MGEPVTVKLSQEQIIQAIGNYAANTLERHGSFLVKLFVEDIETGMTVTAEVYSTEGDPD